MTHSFKRILAFFVLTAFVFLQTAGFSKSFFEVYSFDAAKQVSQTEHVSYAVTDNGTFLQRVVFQGVVKDFIMKFVDTQVLLIPLTSDRLEQQHHTEDVGMLTGFQEKLTSVPYLSSVWFSTYILVLFGVLGILTLEIQKLLLALAQSRKGQKLFVVHIP